MQICKKLTATLAAALLVLAMVPSSLAEDANSTLNSPGESEAAVKLTVATPTFKVTVPTVLTVGVTANGAITTGTTAKIINESAADVVVTNVDITAANPWSLIKFDADKTSTVSGKVNSKTLGLQLTLDSMATIATSANGSTESLSPSNWVITPGDDGKALAYAANVSAQSAATTTNGGDTIANVVFTVAWDTVS